MIAKFTFIIKESIFHFLEQLIVSKLVTFKGLSWSIICFCLNFWLS